ncbi:MAG: acetylxylan esterase [Verrucomicrobiota bacterium]
MKTLPSLPPWFLLTLVVVLSERAGAASAQSAPGGLPPPVQMTADQDHQRMMDLLHITSLRPGADNRNPQPTNPPNYDESKANPHPSLPDPLLLKNGQEVTTPDVWWNLRRPEIVEDFDREIYGRVPKMTPKVTWEVAAVVNGMNGNIPTITKSLVGHVDNSACPQITVNIALTLTLPANASGPCPVMMVLAGGAAPGGPAGGGPGGRQGGTNGLAGSNAPVARPGGVGGASAAGGPPWHTLALSNGWGYATLSTSSIQADNGAGLTQGIIGLVNKGQPRGLEDWGVLRAWAWGASRALDYFETDKAVNARQVGIEGHSRWGKATAVAMAYDARFAIAYSSSSGEGGARIHRRNFGEALENVAGRSEYHWMAGNFLKYAGPLTPADLPVDAHELLALCAPRPVFIGGGRAEGRTNDAWADPKGMFEAAAGAGPVYKLLGGKDLGTTNFPPIETALIAGDIAFRQHSGGHTDEPNWPAFFDFASHYIKGPSLRGTAPANP